MTRPKDTPSEAIRITGMGAVTPFGPGVAAYWESIVKGGHAFSSVGLFPAASHRTHIAAEIKTLPALRCNRLDKTLLSRADIFALCAAKEALTAANLLDHPSGRVSYSGKLGIVVGTAAGGILGLEQFFRSRYMGIPIDAPLTMLTSFCLSATGTLIAAEFGIEGPRLTIATVCSSSGLALAAAYELLAAGRLDGVLAVGTESLSEVTLAGFNALRSVAPDVCRPFDVNRKGLILGEGAGAMVLERGMDAGARPCPTLTGYGLLTDVHHFTAPHPEGAAVCQTIRLAMKRAGISPETVDYVNAHGTGTLLNDAAECLGIKATFGDQSSCVAVSSTKSMTGHTLGAAGILEAIAVVLTMKTGTIPPTANLQTPAPDCELDLVPINARKKTVHRALSNSFAFGGSNLSLVFENRRKSAREGFDSGVPARIEPVITGMGIVSPYGKGIHPFSEAIFAGRSGLTSLSVISEEWRGISGGWVDLSAIGNQIPVKLRRHFNRQASFLYLALQEALSNARLETDALISTTIAYGSAFGCSGNVHRFFSQALKDGPRFVSPQEFNFSVTNAPPALIAQSMNLAGPLWVFVSDEVSFDICLQWAADQIKQACAERVIVCAAEEISESILAIHHHIGYFESRHTDFRLGEGAVCFVLESRTAAELRGAPIYGGIGGWTSRQDIACGPLDFSATGRFLAEALSEIMDEDTTQNGRKFQMNQIRFITPENGVSDCDTAVAQAVAQFAEIAKNPGFKVIRIKHLVGESGFAGGAGLVAALRDAPSDTQIFSLNSSRGGVHTATWITTGPKEP